MNRRARIFWSVVAVASVGVGLLFIDSLRIEAKNTAEMRGPATPTTLDVNDTGEFIAFMRGNADLASATIADPANALTLGNAVCSSLQAGALIGSVLSTVSASVSGEGITNHDAEMVVVYAIKALCPVYLPELKTYIATYS